MRVSRGPGRAQRQILELLADGARSVEELAAITGRRRPNVVRAVSSLQDRGHVLVTEHGCSLSPTFDGPVSDAARLAYEGPGWSVYTATWRALLEVVPECDAVITDPPFSARTHAGHDSAARNAGGRRVINFAAWTDVDVASFVSAWSPRCRGWFVAITDHVLVPAWEAAFRAAGRVVFPPIPCIERGGRCRLQGDGPSSCTDFAMVARPRGAPWSKWGTLPSYYSFPRESGKIAGGKALALMRALVGEPVPGHPEGRGYSRPGDLVVDPLCGGGTTLRASIELGRRAVGGDALEHHALKAAARCGEPIVQEAAE